MLRARRTAIALALILLSACTSENVPHATQADGAKDVPAKVSADIADHERAAGNPTGAIPFYQRALAIDPDQPKIRLAMAQAMLEAGAPNDAADAFRKVLEKSPRETAAQIGLGMALVQLGQFAAAIEPLRKGLAIAPEPRGYRVLGVAENLLGRNADAEADYGRGLALAPDDQGLRGNLGLSLALDGNFDGAIAILRQAAGAADATPRTRQNLALALGLAGRPDEAAQVARADLDEPSVQSNLSYYAKLRAMSAQDRTQTLLRPAPAPVATR